MKLVNVVSNNVIESHISLNAYLLTTGHDLLNEVHWAVGERREVDLALDCEHVVHVELALHGAGELTPAHLHCPYSEWKLSVARLHISMYCCCIILLIRIPITDASLHLIEVSILASLRLMGAMTVHRAHLMIRKRLAGVRPQLYVLQRALIPIELALLGVLLTYDCPSLLICLKVTLLVGF